MTFKVAFKVLGQVIGFVAEPLLVKRILDHFRKRDRVFRPPHRVAWKARVGPDPPLT
jgi:hypothetical protein